MSIQRLSAEAACWLKNNQYTKTTIYINYVRFWNGLVKSVAEDADFTPEVSTSYVAGKYGWNILGAHPQVLPPKEYRVYRAFKALEEFHELGVISGSSMAGASVRKELLSYEKIVMDCYMQHIDNLGYSAKTKRYSYAMIHHYLLHCPLADISDNHVLEYFNIIAIGSKQTLKSRLKVLKRFLVYCREKRFIDADYSALFPSSKKQRSIDIPSVYTPAEITTLLDYLKDNNENRKRNYALVMLIAVYGFRAGDLVDMRLSDIDWDNGIIRIVQSKTKNVLEHRFIPQTGNALESYILDERPNSGNPHLFLKQDGKPLNSTSASSMIFNAFLSCGIDINGRKHGAHSLRHSLASNMLSLDFEILDVSKALGHSSLDTSKIYAKVDINRLRMCELEVSADE